MLVRQIFKEYACISEDKEFRTKAVNVSAEELSNFENSAGTYVPTLTKPLKFDLRKGGGSKWNTELFRLLAQECQRSLTKDEPRFKVSPRVRQPQLEQLMKVKYQRAWGHYSLTLPRLGESEADRGSRVLNTLNRTDVSRRQHSARTYKYDRRRKIIDEQLSRGESRTAMQFASSLLKELGEDGMSSEEEMRDENDVLKGFKTSQMDWRHPDIDILLNRIDTIGRQIKNPQGAIAAPRFTGNSTKRKAVLNLPHEFYNRAWLQKQVDKGFIVAREGSRRGQVRWMGLSSWEASLNRQ